MNKSLMIILTLWLAAPAIWASEAIYPITDIGLPNYLPAAPMGVAIPYPNQGQTSDTPKGSKKVFVKGHEVILENKHFYKRAVPDRPETPSGATHGKVYFQPYSFDVKLEGKQVPRPVTVLKRQEPLQSPLVAE